MILPIGEKIRKLRLKAQITQEALAVYLGVTPQAISRWESGYGYPDIETLPRLADFFSVSTDELLGVNLSQREERMAQIGKEIRRLAEVGSDDENLDFARQAVAQFPAEIQLQKNLADCICRKYMWEETPDKQVKALEEAEKIYLTILDSPQIGLVEYETLFALCSLYSCGFHDAERAKAVASRLPDMKYCREALLAGIFHGEGGIPYMQDYIEKLTGALGSEIENLVLNGMTNEPEKWDLKIQMLETVIALYTMIFGPDLKFYNCSLSHAYRVIATYLVAQGKVQETLDALEQAAQYAVAYDKAFESEHGATYTSPYVDHIVYEEPSANF